MTSHFAFNLWQGIEKYQRDFERLVGHQILWDDVL
jgi:hypothetical protein